MSQLSPPQIDELARELDTTIADFDELDLFVGLATGDRLFSYWVTPGFPLIPTMRQLLERLGKEGQVSPFLSVVYARRPARNDIRELIKSMAPDAATDESDLLVGFSFQKRGARETDETSGASGFQRVIKKQVPLLDPDRLVAFTQSARRRVCKIELNGGALGTGFLVGPAAVLTNWHVVEKAHKADRLGKIACRFDYAERIDGSRSEGTPVALHADPLLCHRPYAPAEATAHPENPPPAAIELDYALLRLAEPAGDTRGWFTLPAASERLPLGAPLIIVQHPDGAPIKIAIDTAAILPLPPPPQRPRIRYATNTEAGSSGSACFTMNFDLVALHHLGDPVWPAGAPQFNQGIPIDLIRSDIISANCGAALGGPIAN